MPVRAVWEEPGKNNVSQEIKQPVAGLSAILGVGYPLRFCPLQQADWLREEGSQAVGRTQCQDATLLDEGDIEAPVVSKGL